MSVRVKKQQLKSIEQAINALFKLHETILQELNPTLHKQWVEQLKAIKKSKPSVAKRASLPKQTKA